MLKVLGFQVTLAMLLSCYSSMSLACAVCGFGAGESRVAFLQTTFLLTLVPLLTLAAIGFYIWRRHRSVSRSHEKMDI